MPSAVGSSTAPPGRLPHTEQPEDDQVHQTFMDATGQLIGGCCASAPPSARGASPFRSHSVAPAPQSARAASPLRSACITPAPQSARDASPLRSACITPAPQSAHDASPLRSDCIAAATQRARRLIDCPATPSRAGRPPRPASIGRRPAEVGTIPAHLDEFGRLHTPCGAFEPQKDELTERRCWLEQEQLERLRQGEKVAADVANRVGLRGTDGAPFLSTPSGGLLGISTSGLQFVDDWDDNSFSASPSFSSPFGYAGGMPGYDKFVSMPGATS